MKSPYARLFLVAVLMSAGVLGTGATAHAQSAKAPPTTPLKADFKGAIGLGLIGAELGFVIPAAAGAEDAWAFIVFPVLGAAGGAAAGYFALEKGNHAELSVAALTVGMILVIPTIVLTVSATAYDPDEEPGQATAPGSERALARAKQLRDPRYAGTGLVRVAQDGVALATPGVAVIPDARAPRDLRSAELRMSLLSGRF